MLHENDHLVFNTLTIEHLKSKDALDARFYQVETPKHFDTFGNAVSKASCVLDHFVDELDSLCSKAIEDEEDARSYLIRSTNYILQEVFNDYMPMQIALCYNDVHDEDGSVPVLGYVADHNLDKPRVVISVAEDEKTNSIMYTLGYIDPDIMTLLGEMNRNRIGWNIGVAFTKLKLFLNRHITGSMPIANEDRCVIGLTYVNPENNSAAPIWDTSNILGCIKVSHLDTEEPVFTKIVCNHDDDVYDEEE